MSADWQSEFQENGVVHLPQFFDEDYSRSLRSMWSVFSEQLNAPGGPARDARFVFGVLPPPVGDIYKHPRLVQLATSLLGPDVALYMNRLLLKDKAWNGQVEIHQDMPYFHGGLDKVSIFVPLKPVQASGGNGGLKFVRGSHKYGNLQRGTIDRLQFGPMSDLAPSADVGDIIVMNFLTWHYSEGATAGEDRPLLQIVYQPAGDGSYASAKLGVAEPTLVTGKWRTSFYTEWNRGVAT